MRKSVTYAWLVALLASLPAMQGCDQKAKAAQTQTLAPPIVDAPPPKPDTVSQANLPPVVVGTPQPAQPAPDANANTPPPPKKKPAHKKTTPPSTTPAEPAQEASNPAPSVSAIGELSGGASGNLRTQTEEMINSTEKGVNGITRTLNEAETKTQAQIREFLKQARVFLNNDDVDGAKTLAKKAKVLLDELNQ